MHDVHLMPRSLEMSLANRNQNCLADGTVWPRVGSPILHAAGGKTQRFEMLRAEADCDMCVKLISVGARFLQPAD